MVNASWLANFPGSKAEVLPPELSDHAPLLVTVFAEMSPGRTFSFLNCWVASPSFMQVVRDGWSGTYRGTCMYQLFRKLSDVRRGLSTLHKQEFWGLTKKVNEVWSNLKGCEHSLMIQLDHSDLIAQESVLIDKYRKLKTAELQMLHQRAKVQGINLNDCSSKYFFARIASRKQQSIVGQIHTRNGELVKGIDKVNAAFVDFYEDLLGKQTPVSELDTDFIAAGA
ncbi:hypothetical protein RND81_12G023100 [Saponaria officinalis]|uniref:Uncharacterized protein n=1 Tax=Saponaria officinalis TaxID=3572 RepID=A0AAW1H4P7_SAPOF